MFGNTGVQLWPLAVACVVLWPAHAGTTKPISPGPRLRPDSRILLVGPYTTPPLRAGPAP